MKKLILFSFFFLLTFILLFLFENSNNSNYLRIQNKLTNITNDCLKQENWRFAPTLSQKLLSDSNKAYSQFGQDLFLYHNIFRQKTNGFYIDVGSYHPTFLSNTYLFDKFFNWSGLCLDMNDFHKELYKDRNCKFIQTCISNRTYVDYYKSDDSIANGIEGTSRTYCQSFQSLLEIHNSNKKIDLLSIDIEGDEYYALQTFPFDLYQVQTILVETFHSINNKNNQNNRDLIFDLLETKGFVHVIQIGPDDLFVNTKQREGLSAFSLLSQKDCEAIFLAKQSYWLPNNFYKIKEDIRNNVGNT